MGEMMFTEQDIRDAIAFGTMIAVHTDFSRDSLTTAYIRGLKKAKQYLKEVDNDALH